MLCFTRRLILFLAIAGGCAEPTYDAPSDEPKRVCDIREDACQQRALDLAATLRGTMDRPPVTVAVVEAEAFIADLEARERREALPPEERTLRRGLSLLGASTVPSDLGSDVRSIYEKVGAFYRHSERAITILDRGKPMDDVSAFTLLVHEMTHALQGAEGLLDRDEGLTNSDSWLAARAMVEGEAKFIEWRAYPELEGRDEGALNWTKSIERYQAYYEDLAAKSPDLYRDRYILFPYSYGVAYVYDAFAIGGMSEVRRLFGESAPKSTIDVMRGYRGYLAYSPYPQTMTANDVLIAQPGEAWRMAGVSHLGGWLLGQITNRLKAPFRWDDLLRGDSLTIVERPSSTGGEPEVALYWRVELEHPEDSKSLRESLPHLVTSIDRAAIIAIRSGSSEGALPADPVTWGRQVQADALFGPQPKSAADHELRCGMRGPAPVRDLQPSPSRKNDQ